MEFKISKLLKLLEKLNISAQKTSYRDDAYIAKSKEYKLTWYMGENDEAHCVHLCSIKQERDAMQDYFPGWFPKTYKEIRNDLMIGVKS